MNIAASLCYYHDTCMVRLTAENLQMINFVKLLIAVEEARYHCQHLKVRSGWKSYPVLE